MTEKNSKVRPLICYIANVRRAPKDPCLKSRGLKTDLSIFAIPYYGLQFKARVEGKALDLEFGSFFFLLRYITTSLEEEKIKSVQVLSSSIEFVFAFTGQLPHLVDNGDRKKLLREFEGKLEISIGLVEKQKNLAYLPLGNFPRVPVGAQISIKRSGSTEKLPKFRPFQRGVKL